MKILGKIIPSLALALVMLFAFSGTALAIPTLQVDVEGGTYDTETETIVSSGDDTFTVYAYLIPDSSNSLSDTYYFSIALVPSTDTADDLGSFTADGTTVNVTGDMSFGYPPLEEMLAKDPGDLAGHGIYPTYYYEYGFTFDGSNQITAYNTQDRAISGEEIDLSYDAEGGMYYFALVIDMSDLSDTYGLHFDLYNSEVIVNSVLRGNGNNVNSNHIVDVDVTQFAPFSHDGEVRVPEPSTLLLLGAAMVFMGLLGLKKKVWQGKAVKNS